LVFGGSLGALRINRAALDAARHWVARSDLHLRHVVGSRDWTEITAGGPPVPAGPPPPYPAVGDGDDMPTPPPAARRSRRMPRSATRPWSTTTTCPRPWRRPTSRSAARGRAPASSCW